MKQIPSTNLTKNDLMFNLTFAGFQHLSAAITGFCVPPYKPDNQCFNGLKVTFFHLKMFILFCLESVPTVVE